MENARTDESRSIWSETSNKFFPGRSAVTQDNDPPNKLPSNLKLFFADALALVSCKTYTVDVLKSFFSIYLHELSYVAPY